MKTKKFKTTIYYSSLCIYIIEAANEVEALEKARKLRLDEREIMVNLQPWEDADEVEEIKNYEDSRKQIAIQL